MRLLVTGAGGMLGADVARVARDEGHDVVALARAELDVTDAAAVATALTAARPQAVVNCAAWTDVDGAESNLDRARAVNAIGAGNVARATAAAGARLVHVSTDYVFDGTKRVPYVESDATNPRSAYGATKLDGERAVVAAGGSHAIVRSSWLFGTGGRNFVATMLAAGTEREEIAVVTDQVGCPTFTGHLAGALLELAASAETGVFHVAGTGACSWHDFAVAIFQQAGLRLRVTRCTTVDLRRDAARPAYSVLVSERSGTPLLPPWQEGLAAYLSARKVPA